MKWLIEKKTERLAELFCEYMQNRISGSNQGFSLALTGGQSAKVFYRALAREFREGHIDPGAVEFYWSDERLVPPDDSDSNFRESRETLLDPAHVPPANIHRAPTQEGTSEECAAFYAREIRASIKAGARGTPAFNIVLLGMGEDGHTASLFPHTDLFYRDADLVRVAAATPAHPHDRLTFTPLLLNSASEVWFLITGTKKAAATAKLYHRSVSAEEVPALVVDPQRTLVTYFVDGDAASLLKH